MSGKCQLLDAPRSLSCLHRFGSAINQHVHLHTCVTEGVFPPLGRSPRATSPRSPNGSAAA
ncbi:MAG: transposase [Planctomycetes bacterium]|nr:transposase [Planctomycetota bacterium]